MKKYKYKFSVIIPIYNVENYLEETIESVINQTLDFKKFIEIILVNDGSPDNSEAICLKYQQLYPENIKYIKQENSGVSSARNEGINYAEGEIINFLDSDDKWEKDVFEKAIKMYEENEDIDVIGVRQKYFEALETYPSLDFKFTKDKVVDIFNSYNHIQLSVTSAFIKTEAIEDIRFDTRIKYSEDAKFLTEIIFKKEKLGIISSSLHLYRKRLSDNSAIQNKIKNVDWYTVTPELCYKYVFELSRKKYGYVIPYVQFYVMYDYQWRIKDIIPNEISEKVRIEYLNTTKELYQDIEDYIILEQKNINIEYKVEFLKLKYNRDITKEFKYKKHIVYFNGYKIFALNKKEIMSLKITNFTPDFIEIRGLINLFLNPEDYKIYALVNKETKIPIELQDTKIYERKAFNKSFICDRGFRLNIPTKDFETISFFIEYRNHYITRMNFNLGLNSKLDISTKLFYKTKDKIYYYYRQAIKAKDNTIKNRLWFHFRKLAYNLKMNQVKVIIYRTVYAIMKLINHKKIWLISDRPPVANDNGFALFEYICKQKNKKIKPYFVIEKNSPDYAKVKRVGKPIIYNSTKYRLYFLLADKIISSQADPWTTNPFGKRHTYYHDLYNANFIFLQHGIATNDLSAWLNCYAKDIKLFITSAKKEYNSIINGYCGFTEKEVKLTGLPRYDKLDNENKKIIAIMPTWRLKLASKSDPKTGLRHYNYAYKNSEYFNFYNSLINDKRLLKIMNENGYKGIFVVHPSHVENYIDYTKNDTFEIIKGFADYQKIFKEASLLISDYSSVLFDFAYLDKPIIYAQFDKEEFYSTHLFDKGYFDYEEDGFGPVKNNYEDIVNEIIKYIENGCKMKDEYQDKIDNFYQYHDKNNCKRVYEEIIKL